MVAWAMRDDSEYEEPARPYKRPESIPRRYGELAIVSFLRGGGRRVSDMRFSSRGDAERTAEAMNASNPLDGPVIQYAVRLVTWGGRVVA